MTYAENLETKAQNVKVTWGKRCDILLFISDIDNKEFPAIGMNTSTGRKHLASKTMRAFRYIYQNHFADADWFMKADDDTYVIIENLKQLLSMHSPSEPIYFGHPLKTSHNEEFISGGAGYVISKEALKR